MDKSSYEVFYTDVKPITYVSLILILALLIVPLLDFLDLFSYARISLGLTLILAPLFIVLFSLAIIIAVAIFAIPRMRYELHETELVIVFGPWKERVPYSYIANVLVKDLLFSVLSTFRLPGVALFDVMYSDEEIVRMYSTHALKDVVLIQTLKKKYGISPKDKSGFLSSLGKHLNIEISYVSEHHEKTQIEKGSKSFIAFVFWGIVIAQFIVFLAFYPRLPEKVVIHWDLQGNPNGYAGKFWGIFGLQLFFIPAWLLPLFMKMKDKQYTYETLTPVAFFCLLIQIDIILVNLGYRINDKLVDIASLLLVFLAILIAIFRAPKTKKRRKL